MPLWWRTPIGIGLENAISAAASLACSFWAVPVVLLCLYFYKDLVLGALSRARELIFQPRAGSFRVRVVSRAAEMLQMLAAVDLETLKHVLLGLAVLYQMQYGLVLIYLLLVYWANLQLEFCDERYTWAHPQVLLGCYSMGQFTGSLIGGIIFLEHRKEIITPGVIDALLLVCIVFLLRITAQQKQDMPAEKHAHVTKCDGYFLTYCYVTAARIAISQALRWLIVSGPLENPVTNGSWTTVPSKGRALAGLAALACSWGSWVWDATSWVHPRKLHVARQVVSTVPPVGSQDSSEGVWCIWAVQKLLDEGLRPGQLLELLVPTPQGTWLLVLDSVATAYTKGILYAWLIWLVLIPFAAFMCTITALCESFKFLVSALRQLLCASALRLLGGGDESVGARRLEERLLALTAAALRGGRALPEGGKHIFKGCWRGVVALYKRLKTQHPQQHPQQSQQAMPAGRPGSSKKKGSGGKGAVGRKAKQQLQQPQPGRSQQSAQQQAAAAVKHRGPLAEQAQNRRGSGVAQPLAGAAQKHAAPAGAPDALAVVKKGDFEPSRTANLPSAAAVAASPAGVPPPPAAAAARQAGMAATASVKPPRHTVPTASSSSSSSNSMPENAPSTAPSNAPPDQPLESRRSQASSATASIPAAQQQPGEPAGPAAASRRQRNKGARRRQGAQPEPQSDQPQHTPAAASGAAGNSSGGATSVAAFSAASAPTMQAAAPRLPHFPQQLQQGQASGGQPPAASIPTMPASNQLPAIPMPVPLGRGLPSSHASNTPSAATWQQAAPAAPQLQQALPLPVPLRTPAAARQAQWGAGGHYLPPNVPLPGSEPSTAWQGGAAAGSAAAGWQEGGVAGLGSLHSSAAQAQQPHQHQHQQAQQAEAECTTCWERPRETTLAPCGHRELCLLCTRMLLAKQGQPGGRAPECPICRCEVESFILRQYVA